MTRPFIIDCAPGKELIDHIASDKSIDAYRKLYDLRKKWNNGYPLVSDQLITYGIFYDMLLTSDVKMAILPTAIEIALFESPEYFHCALFALSELIPEDQILLRPRGFGEKLLKLREKVKKYSFMLNLTGTWETLITRAKCLKPAEFDISYEKSTQQLQVSSKAFLDFFPMPSIGEEEQSACPVSMEKIIEEGNKTFYAGATCNFEKSALIRTSQWWVFRCNLNAPNFIWINYIYVRQDEDQEIEIGRWSSHSSPMSESRLHVKLLNQEFSPRRLKNRR